MAAAPRWTTCKPDSALTALLAESLACPRPLAALLVSRGILTADHARRFLSPTLDDLHDPTLMLGMAAAVARIQHALALAQPILIYGDYDVDGTTATVLLKSAIERVAPPDSPAQVTFHVPHRLREGYGILGSRLAEAAAAGVRLVISVDTGIRAFAAAAEAQSLGLDLIVTDHHLPDSAAGVPQAVAVLDPNQPGCHYPNKHLCGAGVAFKLAHALLAAHATTPARQHRLRTVLLPSFLKIVAVATIADSVELTGENRAITLLGLRELRNPVQPGLRALMQIAQLPLDQPPTAHQVGFRLAPRINAAGRMDVASDVVDLLLTRDPACAESLAQKLDTLNQQRRASEAAALEAIELQLAALADTTGTHPSECIVLDNAAWHRGVLGILASRIVDRTGRPALVLSHANGEAHGSGRSIPGYHLLDAITASHLESGADTPLFTRFGGHAHAVGFSLPARHIELLRRRMQLHSRDRLTPRLLQPELACDIELSPEEISPDFVHWLERCAPFGAGNPEPVFITRGLTLSGPPRIIREGNLCLPLQPNHGNGSLSAVAWSRPGRLSWPERIASLQLQAGSKIDAVFHLRENQHPQYGGLELALIDLAIHAEDAGRGWSASCGSW